jgi:hypothetical protein
MVQASLTFTTPNPGEAIVGGTNERCYGCSVVLGWGLCRNCAALVTAYVCPAEKVSGTESIEWIQTVPDTFMPPPKPSRFLDARAVEKCGAKDRLPIFRPTFFDGSEFRMPADQMGRG